MKNLAWHQRDYDLTADLRHCKYLNVDLSKTYCLLTVFYVFLSEVPVPAPVWRLLQVWLDARLPGYRRCPSSHHLGTRPIGRLAWSRRCKCGATFHHAPPVATGQPALDPSISQSIDKYVTKYATVFWWQWKRIAPDTLGRLEATCLVVDEQLYWIIAPFDQHNLIGLARHPVGEGGSYTRSGAGLDPHAKCEGVHLWQALCDAAIQVVGSLREAEFKLLRRLEVSSSCNDAVGATEEKGEGDNATWSG